MEFRNCLKISLKKLILNFAKMIVTPVSNLTIVLCLGRSNIDLTVFIRKRVDSKHNVRVRSNGFHSRSFTSQTHPETNCANKCVAKSLYNMSSHPDPEGGSGDGGNQVFVPKRIKRVQKHSVTNL